MQIDDPDVIAEARAVFDRYEAAIAANDAAVLDASFWADPRTVRFGTTEILYGIEAIRAFRNSVARYAPRATRRVQITSFGRDFACTHLEYQRTDSGLIGRGDQDHGSAAGGRLEGGLGACLAAGAERSGTGAEGLRTLTPPAAHRCGQRWRGTSPAPAG